MNEYDFTQLINTPQLIDEINTAGLSTPDIINSADTAVQIFYANALTADQLTTLTTVVANHVANANYTPLAVQADINKLVGYLNSANATVANTARAMIVANMAPRLPVDLIKKINSQISAIVGF